VGLLGTKFTMEEDFYKGRLSEKYNIEVIVPNSEERKVVHDVIYNELCLGLIIEDSKTGYKDIIKNLAERGAEGVILGLTIV
jgi:aspartate racemase